MNPHLRQCSTPGAETSLARERPGNGLRLASSPGLLTHSCALPGKPLYPSGSVSTLEKGERMPHHIHMYTCHIHKFLGRMGYMGAPSA